MRNTPKELARKKNKRNKEVLKTLLLEAKKVNGGYNPQFTNKVAYYPNYEITNTENNISYSGSRLFFRNEEMLKQFSKATKELLTEYLA